MRAIIIPFYDLIAAHVELEGVPGILRFLVDTSANYCAIHSRVMKRLNVTSQASNVVVTGAGLATPIQTTIYKLNSIGLVTTDDRLRTFFNIEVAERTGTVTVQYDGVLGMNFFRRFLRIAVQRLPIPLADPGPRLLLYISTNAER